MITEKTLYDLKVGDEVVLFRDGKPREVRKVEKVTPKQICLGLTGSWKFRKEDGKEIGGSSYSYNRIRIVTPEILDQIKTNERHSKLWEKQLYIKKEDTALINEVYDFLKSKNLI